ncbi:RNA-guided endonuclease InsQ/TnpB family protein [Butyrivibrio sp. INlla21]|uniref:RNA-guided endonuclease InsQ/TnpB family protein n=1 Tax=Butyrivibrio sp. INlla21 TaxID=1520811 RepID=UPI0008E4BA47|nr:RNA-guided endonuclease TnpB family protein [Butyrivibrio sp. INlla21]SFU57544.1 putative transposase [Butyrivibrio sp. INlla21]
MIVSYKTEINPTQEQIQKINQTIGTCRYIYNFYLATQKERYEHGEKLQSAMDFSKWLNNDYLSQHEELSWIKEVSSKSVKQSIANAYGAYQKFFKRQSKFPKFKKKGKSDVKMYFVKTDAKAIIRCERHRIKIPTLGWVRLKEKGYIPTTKSSLVIKSGTVSEKAGRYYVSVLIDVPKKEVEKNTNQGVGIDLGIKDLAICSDKQVFANINKSKEVKRLEKKLKREQRSLSRMYENKKKGESTQKNIQKQKRKVQRIHHRLDNIRTDYINKAIAKIVKTKPSYITIEDLNISGMMKNRHLSKAISQQKLYEFRTKITNKCHQNNIELRIVDRWFPSSKICNCCGNIKKDLKLSDRTYICACRYVADRDYNASLNLRDCKDYQIA